MLVFQIVVAATRQGGIGKDGTLPWKLPGDMAYFKKLTTTTRDAAKKNAVIMGRKTWESIPKKFRPLSGRVNVVLSRQMEEEGGMVVKRSLEDAMAYLQKDLAGSLENVFVIGGGEVYKEALASPLLSAIHLTRVEGDVDCDTFMPEVDETRFKLWHAGSPRRDTPDGMRYSFLCYTRVNVDDDDVAARAIDALPVGMARQHEEFQYLDMIQEIIDEGTFRGDRTGTGTYSKFGKTMRFNLRHTFPLLTTKRVFWRGLAEELLWFIKGSTNATELSDKGIHIWDGNGSREYLDSIGLTEREEGDLGPVYGFQWRHFGAEYSNMHADYSGKGVDQLNDLIHKIKNNPNDRRLVLTAWNPLALPEMALPPCHMFCQFYVADGELSCQMYQRSCDLGLGVPFNIASYALLTRMVAHVCGLVAGDFVHVLGDAHVYANHVDPLKEQLQHYPRHLPTLRINSEKKNIDEFTFDDFEIVDYKPHKKIQMKMAV
ncbi:hypothetical protein M9434_001122 [Picochlorum sp. BPE23]|nr:hypothetical protein M9434_001122 [Picochlorum sp. BPE23]KAI8111862.1 hypothetical protein M9435_004360 [Picochlorum sp. BPE23]